MESVIAQDIPTAPGGRTATMSEIQISPAGAHDIAFETFGDPAALAHLWRAFETDAAGHVFQTYDYVAAWVRHVAAARGIEPRIVVARAGSGRLLAILPLGVGRRMGVRVLSWLGGDQSDYHCGLFDRAFLAGLHDDPAAAEAFRRAAVAAASAGADVVRFTRQPAAIDGLSNPFAGPGALDHASQAHETRLEGSFEAYYTAKRGKSSRRIDKRKLDKLTSLGPLRLVDATDPGEIRRIMAALVAMKRDSLAARGISDIFGEPGVRDFYEAIAQTAAAGGPAHVAALYCGDDIAACSWGLVHGRRYYYVLHTYAGGEIGRCSPGKHLMYHLMQWAIARGVDAFDFTVGDEPYKAEWCEVSQPLRDTVASLSARGSGLAMALHAGATAKRVIKTTPILWRGAEALRRRLGPVAAG